MPDANLSVYLRFKAEMGEWNAALHAGKLGLKGIGDAAQQASSMLRGVTLFIGGGLSGMAAGLTLIGKEGLGAASSIEQLNLALGVLLKSKELATKTTELAYQRAATTPFETTGIGQFVTTLLSAGIAVDKIIGKKDDLLTVLGDAAAIMAGVKKVSPDQMLAEVAGVYTSIRGGMLQRERLLQFGVSPEEIAKELGTKLSGQGELKQEFKALAADAFLRILKERFAGGQGEFATTLEGLMSTFRDSLKMALKPVGEEIMPELKGLIKEISADLTKLGEDPRILAGVRRAAQLTIEVLKPLVAAGTGYLAQLLEYLSKNPEQLVLSMFKLQGAIKDVGIALGVLVGAQGLLWLITLFSRVGTAATTAALAVSTKLLPAMRGLGLLMSVTMLPALGDMAKGLLTLNFTTAASGATSFGAALTVLGARVGPLVLALGPLAILLAEIVGLVLAIKPSRAGSTPQGMYEDISNMIKEGVDRKQIELAINELESMPGGEWGSPGSGKPLAAVLREQLKLTPELAPWNKPPPGFAGLGSGKLAKPGAERHGGAGGAETPGDDQTAATALSQQEQLLKGAEAETLKRIGGLPGGKGKICVVKTRDGVLVLGGDTPEAKLIHAALSGSDSMQSVTPKLAAATKQTLEPKVGDIIVLDRKGGPNAGADGHMGFFLGYDAQGRVIMSGNSKGGKLTVGSEYGPLQARAYDNSKGVWAYENPASPLRQTMTQMGMLGKDDPLGKALADAQGSLGELSAKLALYKDALGQGILTQAQYDEVNQELTDAKAKLYEQLATSSEGQQVLGLLDPAFAEELRGAWEKSKRSEAFDQLTAAVKNATEAYNKAAGELLSLNEGINSIQQTRFSLRAARAGALGYTMEAAGWEADAAMNNADFQRAQVERFRSLYSADLGGTNGPEMQRAREAELQGAVQQLADAVKGLYDQSAQLTESAPGISKALFDKAESILPYAEGQLGDVQQRLMSAANAQQSAAGGLQVAAAMLQNAAGALGAAKAAAAPFGSTNKAGLAEPLGTFFRRRDAAGGYTNTGTVGGGTPDWMNFRPYTDAALEAQGFDQGGEGSCPPGG